jgi:hypothetical protein
MVFRIDDTCTHIIFLLFVCWYLIALQLHCLPPQLITLRTRRMFVRAGGLRAPGATGRSPQKQRQQDKRRKARHRVPRWGWAGPNTESSDRLAGHHQPKPGAPWRCRPCPGTERPPSYHKPLQWPREWRCPVTRSGRSRRTEWCASMACRCRERARRSGKRTRRRRAPGCQDRGLATGRGRWRRSRCRRRRLGSRAALRLCLLGRRSARRAG